MIFRWIDDLPQFTAERRRLPVGPVSVAPPGAFRQRPALKSSTLNPILDPICTAPDARFIHLFQQDSAYDQSITDAFFVAAVF